MLPKKYRLIKEKDIKQVFKQSRKSNFGSIQTLLRFKKNSDQQSNNFGNQSISAFRALVIVSKKIHKRAVKRNRIRRNFQQALQYILKSMPTAPSLDLVIMVRDRKILEENIQQAYIEYLEQMMSTKPNPAKNPKI